MPEVAVVKKRQERPQKEKNIITLKTLKAQKQLMFMSLPFLAYIILFSYVPAIGWVMAFQDFKPAKSFFNQQWVGFKHFQFLFSDSGFLRVLRNTLAMSFINLVLGFVTAILLALLLNEIKNTLFKRTVQTISYLPHFLSWVIVAGLVSNALSTEDGIINILLLNLGLIKEPILWLGKGEYFWGIVGAAKVWKEVGWNTIIYLSAMSSIDPALYEAADIDGANRYHKMWHITLPGIKPTFVVLLIMSVGHILNAGFEVQYLLGNGLVVDWSETIDIFVLKYGISQFNFSLATAAGIFKTVVSVILIYTANTISKKIGEEQLI